MTPLITLAELARQTGIKYHRVVHGHKTGAIPEPVRVGNHRVYGPDEVAAIVAYFAAKDKEEKDAQEHRQVAG